MKTKSWLMVCAVLAITRPLLADLPDGLLFYVPFDGDSKAVVTKGAEKFDDAAEAKYVDGKLGQAVEVDTAKLTAPAKGVYNRPVGTIAFWYAPAWDGETVEEKKIRSIFSAQNFGFNHYAHDHQTYFMTGKHFEDGGFKWDYGCTTNLLMEWKANEWHHIAFTWNAGTSAKQIFIDGQLAKESETESIRKDETTAKESIVLNENGRAGGKFDELMIWDRVLSPEEIAKVYTAPKETATAIKTAAAKAPTTQPFAP